MDTNKLPANQPRDTGRQAVAAACAETHHTCPQSSHHATNSNLVILICWQLTILTDLTATITNLLKL